MGFLGVSVSRPFGEAVEPRSTRDGEPTSGTVILCVSLGNRVGSTCESENVTENDLVLSKEHRISEPEGTLVWK